MVTIRCKDATFQNIRAVLFDKDGTLASSESFLKSLAQRRSRLIDAQVPGVQEPLLMAFGVDHTHINPAGLMAVGSRLENQIAAAAYVAETGCGWVKSLEIVQSAFREADRYTANKAEQTPLIEGAAELIQQLSKAGLKLGILSSDSCSNIEEFLKKYGLAALIPYQFGVDGYASKGEPALLQHCFAVLGVEPEAVLMIGDSELDIQIARQFQMAGCIAVSGGWMVSAPPTQADAIGSLSEIQVTV
ncbi:MAG: HAD family hydrolase [Elainellaceae cyanobacterium]